VSEQDRLFNKTVDATTKRVLIQQPDNVVCLNNLIRHEVKTEHKN
jgi:hypothetical protein